MKSELVVNGKAVVVEGHPMDRLLDILREELDLIGTKEGCGEGECGACTVLMNGEPVLSCLIPRIQCDSATIETVEGLAAGNSGSFLDPKMQVYDVDVREPVETPHVARSGQRIP